MRASGLLGPRIQSFLHARGQLGWCPHVRARRLLGPVALRHRSVVELGAVVVGLPLYVEQVKGQTIVLISALQIIPPFWNPGTSHAARSNSVITHTLHQTLDGAPWPDR